MLYILLFWLQLGSFISYPLDFHLIQMWNTKGFQRQPQESRKRKTCHINWCTQKKNCDVKFLLNIINLPEISQINPSL